MIHVPPFSASIQGMHAVAASLTQEQKQSAQDAGVDVLDACSIADQTRILFSAALRALQMHEGDVVCAILELCAR